jgi:hypothetical protein
VNRHDRRAKAAQERRSDTMGKSYTVLGELPESVRNSEGFKAGAAAAAKGQGMSPEYFAHIDRCARAVRRWLREHPRADLRWLQWDAGRTFIAAGLDVGASYLADSPDAFGLLVWLDEQFEPRQKPSLNQAGWAIRLLGLMPMPDGSIWKGQPS